MRRLDSATANGKDRLGYTKSCHLHLALSEQGSVCYPSRLSLVGSVSLPYSILSSRSMYIQFFPPPSSQEFVIMLTGHRLTHHVYQQVPTRRNHNHDTAEWRQSQPPSRSTLQEMVVGTYRYLNRDGIDRRLTNVSALERPFPREDVEKESSYIIHTMNRIYIGYPRLVQKEVSASSLHITEMRISNPSPSSFTLHQTQVIGSHSSFHPQIDSFEASVSLLGAAVPFSRVQVSAVKTSDGAVVEIDQVLELGNGSAFGEFVRAFMMSDVVELEISGKPSLKQGGLPRIQVEYDKVVSMKGQESP